MRTLLIITLTALALWSLASLFFYRSSEIHGPDMVGDEVFHFALPLVIALVVVIAAFFAQPILQFPKWTVLTAIFALGIFELVIYSVFVIR